MKCVKIFSAMIQLLGILFLIFFQQNFSDSIDPNIIFILADDLGWNDVGFHGSNQIPTPNIDALAYTGIILNNYYVTPICTPSRSALLTGKYPIHTGLQHGIIHGSAPYGLNLKEVILPIFKRKGYVTRAVGKWHLGSFKKEYTPEYRGWVTFCFALLGMQHRVIKGGEPWGLGLDEVILPRYLKEAGYVTAAVGKWHLGHFRREYLPEERGFDSHYGYWTGHQDYYDHTASESYSMWGYDVRRGMNITWPDYGQYTTDLLTNEAVKIIHNHNSSKPLFLYVAHLAVHSANAYSPLQAPRERVSKFDYIENKNRRLFAGMLSKLDDSVGSIVSALSVANLLNNSIIIFSTDNGGPSDGFDLNAASNWPLRGVKDTFWEGGVRGAGFIWSTFLPSSKINNALIHITDWLPTLLFLTNTSIPDDLDGFNVWSSLSLGIKSPRKEILLNIDTERKIAALKRGNWKYIKGHSNDWNDWYGPSGRNYSYNWTELYTSLSAKAIKNLKVLPQKAEIKELRKAAGVKCFKKITPEENTSTDVYLFDLEKDPCEQQNLASDHQDVVNSMDEGLKSYMKTMVPPRNKPTDPRSNPKYWGYAWVNWMDFL